jgi:hypothetical protein
VRRPEDEDEALFIADQLAEIRDAISAENAERAARLLGALEAEAPDSDVFMTLLTLAGERLARAAGTGDAQARAQLEEFLRIVAGGFAGGVQ